MNRYSFTFFLLLFCLLSVACSSVQKNPQPLQEEPSVVVQSLTESSDSKWKLEKDADIEYLYIRFILALQEKDIPLVKMVAEKLLTYPLPLQMYIEIASFYLVEDNKTVVQSILEKAMQVYPQNFDIILLWTELIENPKTIIKRIEAFSEKNPYNPEARIKLYLLYYEQKLYRNMLTLFENFPADKHIYIDYFYSALAWKMLGNTEKSIQNLYASLEKNGTFIEAWFELGLIYESIQDYTLAQKSYSEGLRKSPDNPEFWTRLIAINLILNQPRKALELVLQGPQTKSFLLSATSLFLENLYYKQAEEILGILRTQYTNTPEINFYYAFLYFERDKNTKKALSYLKKIPVTSFFYPRAIQLEVSLYQIEKDYKTAIEVAERARKKYPQNVLFWDLNGQTLRLAKEYSKAITLYTKALALFPNDISILYGLANIYDEQNNRPKAINIMEKIITIDNDNIGALNYIGYTLTENNTDLSRAKILLEKALFLDSENVSVLDSLAWLYYKQKRFYDAWKLLEKAKLIGIEDQNIWEHYAEIAQQLGLKEEAKYAYKKVLEYNPKNTKAKEQLRSL